MNLKDPIVLARLNRAANDSYDQLGDHRRAALHMLKLYCGQHYNRQLDSGRSQPMNLYRTAVTTLASSITPEEPCIEITSQWREGFAYGLELATATNHVARSIQAPSAIAMSILQSFDSLGIVKIGRDRDSARYFAIDGVEGRLADMFVDFILFDDWVHDVNTRWMPECKYMGNIYSLPFDQVMESKAFKHKDNLHPEPRANMTESGDVRSDATSLDEEVEDIIYLRDMYIPSENVVITTPLDGSQQHRLLCQVDMDENPYRLLSFFDVRGSAMPLPPGADLIDLHEMVSDAQWKLREQMLEYKDWFGIQGGGASDANTVVNVRHGEVVKLLNPQNVREFHTGGPSPQISAFVGSLMNWYNWQTGNINSLGGLAPSAATLGQEELMANAASTYQRQMAKRVQAFVTSIYRTLAKLVHTDKTIRLKLRKQIPNTSISIPFTYKAGKHDGKWLECVFKMSVYGSKHLTPNEEYAALQRLMKDFILPLAQGGQISLNAPAIVREAARYLGYQQIDSLVDLPDAIGSMVQPGKIDSPRVYEHVSRPAKRAQSNWGTPIGIEGGNGQSGQPAPSQLNMMG